MVFVGHTELFGNASVPRAEGLIDPELGFGLGASQTLGGDAFAASAQGPELASACSSLVSSLRSCVVVKSVVSEVR